MTGKIIGLSGLKDHTGVFLDRDHAGEVLAGMLEKYRESNALVLGILAGGVPVAAKIAEKISATLGVEVVSKITLPWNTESGFGAVASDGTVRFNQDLLPHLDLSESQIQACVEQTRDKIARRIKRFHDWFDVYNLNQRPVILVDDGIASGFTLRVAIEAVKNKGADQLIVAVPTGHDSALPPVAAEADTIYCANIRGGLSFAVADAYQNWTDVNENEAEKILREMDMIHKEHINS